jgi:hypothetical protein
LLSDAQLSNLVAAVREWVIRQEFESELFGQPEESFTSNALMPSFEQFVQGLHKPGLIARGDGGTPMKPVVWSEIAFYPDLAVCEFEHRHVAIEVKFLRNKSDFVSDPGGALAKSIGQITLYSKLGYRYSFGMVFDLRNVKDFGDQVVWAECLLESQTGEVHVFR